MPNFAGAQGDRRVPNFTGAGGSGNFKSANDLIGDLLMLTPIKVEEVPQKPEYGGGVKRRLTADTVVLDGPHKGDYPSMWWGQKVIVEKADDILRRDTDQIILGRLVRKPKKEFTKYWATADDLEAAFDKAARGETPPIPQNAYFWTMLDMSDEDVAIATAYVNGEQPAAAPAQADGRMVGRSQRAAQPEGPWGASGAFHDPFGDDQEAAPY